MKTPKRKNNRLTGFDYSSDGAYFITVCTKDMKCIFSTVGAIHESPDNAFVKLTQYGKIVKSVIDSLSERFKIEIPDYVIMPNHVHLIIVIDNSRAIRESPLRSTVSKVIGYFKMNVSKRIHLINNCEIIWQRSFYDHIIRNEEDLYYHLQYIDENPKKWLMGKDEYYS